MKLNTATGIISIAFIISLAGFIISAATPQQQIADTLMVAALFCAAASAIIASVFTKKLVNSRQWKFLVAGVILFLLGFAAKLAGLNYTDKILRVAGGIIVFAALGHYIYMHRADFKNSKWVLSVPFILLGCFFKHMYWPGGNLIMFASLLLIIILSFIQLAKLKQNTKIQLWLLLWQITMCICIFVFYFSYVKFDAFIIGYIFILLALVDIFLHQEKA